MELQPPICDQYPETIEPLVLWPSGLVQRFPSLAHAKAMLMRQHFQYLVMNIGEVRVYISEDVEHWYKRWAFDERDDIPLWQYLIDISILRDPWMKAADVPETGSQRFSKRQVAAGYTINHEACKAFQDAKAPKQAKVLAKIFLDLNESDPIDDDFLEKHLMNAVAKGVLVTKQAPMRIFAYYRSALVDGNCITLR